MVKKIQVFAVLRIDDYISSLEDAVTVKEVLPTKDEAQREVERLNKLNASKRSRYFCQVTRYFPDGRQKATFR
jgi:hypothetical protein